MSQTGRLLHELKHYPRFHFGKGVPNHKLARISLKYSSRIAELRKDGYVITAERDYVAGRASNTFRYYLDAEPQA